MLPHPLRVELASADPMVTLTAQEAYSFLLPLLLDWTVAREMGFTTRPAWADH